MKTKKKLFRDVKKKKTEISEQTKFIVLYLLKTSNMFEAAEHLTLQHGGGAVMIKIC